MNSELPVSTDGDSSIVTENRDTVLVSELDDVIDAPRALPEIERVAVWVGDALELVADSSPERLVDMLLCCDALEDRDASRVAECVAECVLVGDTVTADFVASFVAVALTDAVSEAVISGVRLSVGFDSDCCAVMLRVSDLAFD